MFYILYLLTFLITQCSYQTFASNWSESNGQELLLCRKCGADVADSQYLFSKKSPGAQKIEKQNIFGQKNVTVLTLLNPFGVKFEIVTMEKARCKNVGSNQGADSWFPGYTWRICTCPNCGQHLGWTFEKSSDSHHEVAHDKDHVQSFYGLILSNLLGENCEHFHVRELQLLLFKTMLILRKAFIHLFTWMMLWALLVVTDSLITLPKTYKM